MMREKKNTREEQQTCLPREEEKRENSGIIGMENEQGFLPIQLYFWLSTMGFAHRSDRWMRLYVQSTYSYEEGEVVQLLECWAQFHEAV